MPTGRTSGSGRARNKRWSRACGARMDTRASQERIKGRGQSTKRGGGAQEQQKAAARQAEAPRQAEPAAIADAGRKTQDDGGEGGKRQRGRTDAPSSSGTMRDRGRGGCERNAKVSRGAAGSKSQGRAESYSQAGGSEKQSAARDAGPEKARGHPGQGVRGDRIGGKTERGDGWSPPAEGRPKKGSRKAKQWPSGRRGAKSRSATEA